MSLVRGLARGLAELLVQLDLGPRLLIYVGHGGVSAWAAEGLLTTADIGALRNYGRLPFVVGMSCLSGFFHHLTNESMAEAFLKAEDRGAVAVWTSSGVTTPYEQAVMNQALLTALLKHPRPTLGDAIRMAKKAVRDADVRRTWILFGDPTTRLQL